MASPIHLFAQTPLDSHLSSGSHDRVVLVIRAALFHRYPDAIVTAMRQEPGSNPPTFVDPAAPAAKSGHIFFHGHLAPDYVLVGFDLTVKEVQAGGWWFVISEHPTAPRFGLDEPDSAKPAPVEKRNEFDWDDVALTADRRFLLVSTAPRDARLRSRKPRGPTASHGRRRTPRWSRALSSRIRFGPLSTGRKCSIQFPDMGISNYRFLQSVQRDARAAEAKQASLRAALTSVNAEIVALENDAGELEARGERESARAIREKIKNAEKRRRDHAEEIVNVEERVREILGRLGARIDPCDADPALPLALLPVRLETRYTEDGAALRIRIFPDDIHVDQLDRGLSEDEIAAGKTYWTAAAAGEEAADAAWTTLAATVHEDRAAWVAFALTPTNLEAWEQGGAPEFPKIEPRSRRAAVARLLPDRFVAIAEQSASRSSAIGAVIAPEIVVGILADDGSKMVDVKGVKALPGGEWMFDYQLALEAGLAITLPLQQPGARIDRLYVTGVRASLAPAESADALEDLLHAHRFGRGLAFVPQGTPSNNTEKNRSAWQSRAEPTRLPNPTDPPPAPGSNAQILAAAFGIDAATFNGIAHSTEQRATARPGHETALWSPSWGTFLDRLAVPDGLDRSFVIPDEGREAARDFFRDSVRGRGPLPAIRVGNQPYGILPVSSLDENSWKKDANDQLQTGLLPILQRLRGALGSGGGGTPSTQRQSDGR